MTMSEPLRYEISNWHQLPQAKSNNSDQLYISVGDIVQNDTLTGLRIQIMHRAFGTLFACVRNAAGSIISTIPGTDTENFDDATILKELAKYGFLITYTYPQHLPAAQLEFLISLKALNFDKIRTLCVRSTKNSQEIRKNYIVLFKSGAVPKWLHNTYVPSESEYVEALKTGDAFNVSAASPNIGVWDWSWLDFVANIDDIIAENSNV